MSELPGIDETGTAETTHIVHTNGAALHVRIADLLDDVTVGMSSPRPAPAAVAPEPTQRDTAVAPAPPSQAAPTAPPSLPQAATEVPKPESQSITPPPAAVTQDEDASGLPGKLLFGSSRRTGQTAPADLPPFLQPAEPPGEAPHDTGESAPPATGVTTASMPDAAAPQVGEETAIGNQLVNIKGRSDGIAIEIGKGSWNEILNALVVRLEQSASFFRNGSVAVDVGPRPVIEDELQQLARVLTAHEMKLGVIRTSSERTFQAALAVGYTATLESAEGAPVASATPAATNTDAVDYFVYRGYLRSGHKLRRSESILVIGDINPGAEVISEGDILVWGRLRGVVHAGYGGNRRALVAALDLEPTQMRIADVTSIGPDPRPGQPGRFFWKRSQHKRPEIARLAQSEIVIEEWDASRPGGLVSLRRGTG